MTSVRVAVVQAGSVLFDPAATLEKAEHCIREAASRGAELIVLPEAYLGGYPQGLDFGITVGTRSSEGRELFRRYSDTAVQVPGPETRHLAGVAAELGNSPGDRGRRARRGHPVLHRPLLHPGRRAGGHPPQAHAHCRGTLPVGPGRRSDHARRRHRGGVLGAAVCWENYMPLFRPAMYAKGVQIWCAPTVDDRTQWQASMAHIALEGRCFVLSANQYLTRADLPADVHPVQGEDPATVLIDGGSTIVSPLGEVLAGPLRGTEGVLVAEVDLDEVTRAKFDLDTVGHYARPDVFTLTVDETPRASVHATSGDAREPAEQPVRA